jgi:hypothetical protein
MILLIGGGGDKVGMTHYQSLNSSLLNRLVNPRSVEVVVHIGEEASKLTELSRRGISGNHRNG